MSDYTLKELAVEEMDKLTEEARILLKKELDQRKISLHDVSVDHIQTISATADISKLDKHIVQYITEQKLKKESNAYIVGGLIERGFEEQTALEILNAFPGYLQERKNNMSQTILTGTLQLVSGIAIIELPLSTQTQLAVIIIGYSLVFTGIIRIFHGWLNKNKLTKIQESFNNPFTS